MDGQRRNWLLVGLVGLAFALRIAGLDFQSLWRDEVDAIRFASAPLSAVLHNFLEPGQNGPLYFLLLRPWLALAGRSEFGLRFFSLLLGVVAIPLSYRLGRRLFPGHPSVGLVAAALAATSPYLVWYSQEGKMYALTVALVLFSMDRYLVALERGGWQRWLLYILATSLALYVHLVAALVIPAQAIGFTAANAQRRRERWKPWLASILILTLPYLPLAVWQLPLLLRPGETGYRFLPLPEMFYSLFASYTYGVVQKTGGWTLSLFIGALLALVLLGQRRASAIRPVAFLLCWLLVPPLGFFLVTLVRPMFTARYLIFVLPAYLLLLAAGLWSLGRWSRLAAGLLLAALLAVNGWGLWLQARTPLKADFRAATAYVADRLEPADLILFQIPYGRHSFEYYLSRQPSVPPGPRAPRGPYRVFLPWIGGGGSDNQASWAEGLYTNGGMEPGEVDRRMAEMTAGSRIVWLVATETELWDERGLVQGWLDSHASLVDEARFVRVTVRRYQLW